MGKNIEQHFNVVVNENSKRSLSEILNREPYIIIKQANTIQEIEEEKLMEVWIRFGFEDDSIPTIPSELSIDMLERIVEGYLSDTRAEDSTPEAFMKATMDVINHDYSSYITKIFIEREKIKERIQEEMIYGLNIAIKELSGKRPTKLQIEKIFKYWVDKRLFKNIFSECCVKNYRLDAKAEDIADIYMSYAKSKQKTCNELSLLDAMDENKSGFSDIVAYSITVNEQAVRNWLEQEKEVIKTYLSE